MAGLALHDGGASAAIPLMPSMPAPILQKQQMQQPPLQQQQQHWGAQQVQQPMTVPLPAWTPGSEQWMPPESTNTTTTTYGPIVGGASIYNPAAPPPSASYGMAGAYGVQQPHSSGK
jgi:hypothetical protein